MALIKITANSSVACAAVASWLNYIVYTEKSIIMFIIHILRSNHTHCTEHVYSYLKRAE